MIRVCFALACCLSLCLLVACPKARVVAKRQTLSYAKNYKAWRTISKRKVISPHHGDAEEEIFANDLAYSVSSGKKNLPYPEGATFVMIRYKDGKRFSSALVMRKMGQNYHPNYGNWRYSEVRLSDWTLDQDGKLAPCIRCHFKHMQRDFVPLMQKDGL